MMSQSLLDDYASSKKGLISQARAHRRLKFWRELPERIIARLFKILRVQ